MKAKLKYKIKYKIEIENGNMQNTIKTFFFKELANIC